MFVLRVVTAMAAVLVIAVVLWDTFETVVLPRRVSRRVRLTRLYSRTSWRAWTVFVRRFPATERREAAAAIYGPIAILILLALWASLLIVAYALLLWGLGSPLTTTGGTAEAAGLGTDLYYSGTTFLTLGLGDIFPHTGSARAIAVIEVGTGFGLLALVIGYLPVLYQAFSRREVRISLLDAHAGSPPTAGALIRRHPPNRRAKRLTAILAEWEEWSAELLETHLSYPMLAFYRSQHENQSWVAALAMILDTCALVLAFGTHAPTTSDEGVSGERDELAEQAAVTFAIARHAAVDLAQVFGSPRPRVAAADRRLSPDEHARLGDLLRTAGVGSSAGKHGEGGLVGEGERVEGQLSRLKELRALYESYIEGLAEYLLMALPLWVPAPDALDDWQTTADGLTAPSIASLV